MDKNTVKIIGNLYLKWWKKKIFLGVVNPWGVSPLMKSGEQHVLGSFVVKTSDTVVNTSTCSKISIILARPMKILCVVNKTSWFEENFPLTGTLNSKLLSLRKSVVYSQWHLIFIFFKIDFLLLNNKYYV